MLLWPNQRLYLPDLTWQDLTLTWPWYDLICPNLDLVRLNLPWHWPQPDLTYPVGTLTRPGWSLHVLAMTLTWPIMIWLDMTRADLTWSDLTWPHFLMYLPDLTWLDLDLIRHDMTWLLMACHNKTLTSSWLDQIWLALTLTCHDLNCPWPWPDIDLTWPDPSWHDLELTLPDLTWSDLDMILTW